jgi:hypothetical protein
MAAVRGAGTAGGAAAGAAFGLSRFPFQVYQHLAPARGTAAGEAVRLKFFPAFRALIHVHLYDHPFANPCFKKKTAKYRLG